MWISPTSLFCSVHGTIDFPSSGCVMVQARDKPIGRLESDSQVLCKELCSSSVLTLFMSQLPYLSLHAQAFELLEMSSGNEPE